jgi:hypothetical protein
MKEQIKEFLGPTAVRSLPTPKQFDAQSLGEKLPNSTTKCVSQTRRIIVTPQIAAEMLMGNEWASDTRKKEPNRRINESRVMGELTLLFDLMIEGNFAPHRSTLGVTEDGRLIEGQGRMLAQLKAGLTYSYTVDIVKNDQCSVAQYLGATRGTTATTSLAQLWEITFGLTPKQAVIAQQVFNGVQWHDEGILGGIERTSTKAAICQLEKLPADIRRVSELYASSKVPKGISAPALATIELLAIRKGYSDTKVNAFREGLLRGTDLRARDARYILREFLIGRRSAPKQNIRYQAQVGYIKQAFDKFVAGADMNRVSAPALVKF